MQHRYGVTVPFDPIPLSEHRSLYGEAADLGYTDVWSAEVNGHDAFTPLALAAAWEPRLRLGTAIVPVFTRGPAVLAQSAASLASAAPGRVAIGVGTSTPAIVERWNGLDFDRPYQRTRDVVRFLRAALAGEKVREEYETFTVKGFQLAVELEEPPQLLVAGLRPGMLHLAARESDGAITNYLSPGDVPQVAAEVGPDKELVARIFVAPSDDAETLRPLGKMLLASYLTVPVYRAYQEWLGRGDALGETWERWEAGDRQGAIAAVPDAVVDDLIVHGTPQRCRERIRAYHDAGITTSTLAILPAPGVDIRQALRDLAPDAD